MPRSTLDVTKSLYDSDGYRHTLIQATPMQIVTLLEGFYWLWDRRSGRCLIEAMAGSQLSNTRPAYQDLVSRRNAVVETRAFLMAQEAVQNAAASSWMSARHRGPVNDPAAEGAAPQPRSSQDDAACGAVQGAAQEASDAMACASETSAAASAAASASQPLVVLQPAPFLPRTMRGGRLQAAPSRAMLGQAALPAGKPASPAGALALAIGLLGMALLLPKKP